MEEMFKFRTTHFSKLWQVRSSRFTLAGVNPVTTEFPLFLCGDDEISENL